MRYILILSVLLFGTGCGENTTSTYIPPPDEQEDEKPNIEPNGEGTIIINGSGSVIVEQSVEVEGGLFIYNEDGTVIYISLPVEEIEMSGDYDPSWTKAECDANGYFWCSIEQKCLNQSATGSSCRTI